jgi:Ca2+-binding EF-hand superfamily protein
MTPALARTKNPSPVARFDTDHDGTVDLAEAKRAASGVFDKLDTDKDGTLNTRELSKDEYLAVVEPRFKSADADGDGSVSAAEFATPTGRALARLLA